MCGGIVSALTHDRTSRQGGRPRFLASVAYHGGRITTYVLLGALVGALSAGILPWRQWRTVQLVLYGAAGLVLVYLGWRLWRQQVAWPALERRIAIWLAPLRRQLGSLDARPGIAPRFLVGLIWGCTPCGMVYGALGLAMLAGSAIAGAAMLLVFGLGTLPNLLLAGRLLSWAKGRASGVWRRAGAVLIAGFGLWALLRVFWFPETIGGAPFCALP